MLKDILKNTHKKIINKKLQLKKWGW
jgi:hypothetical protein